jgi:hypothetical protein
MKYFIIKESNDPKVIGRGLFVQAESSHWLYWDNDVYSDKNSILTQRYKKIIPKTYWAQPILKKTAKITDLISSIPVSLPCLSQRMKDILQPYMSEEFQFLKTSLIHKDRLIPDYYFLNPYKIDYEILDLESTEFKILLDVLKYYPPVYKEFHPKSLEEIMYYHNAIYNNCTPDRVTVFNPKIKDSVSGHIYFLMSFYIQTDLFVNCLIISEKVKQELEAAKCTGFDLIEL